jgi:Ima1 N-terminal domain
MNSLASYYLDPDDPAYPAYEREYPKFRRNLEERYPQVCENCEFRVKERIRQTGYEAKADHLRRMMERSKTGRVTRKARNRNWRTLLVFAGAAGHWGSVAGQLSWHLLASMDSNRIKPGEGSSVFSISLSCIKQAIGKQQVESQCSSGLAPYSGLALLLGILSLWWNPKLWLKVEGRSGRFVGLGEYYKVQLIILVVRFVAWALLKDRMISGINPSLSRAMHIFMMGFIILVRSYLLGKLFQIIV